MGPAPMRTLPLLLLLALPLSADDIDLTTGESITDCTVTEEGDFLRITKGGASRTVARSIVKSWVKKPTRDALYAEKRAALKADDLPGSVALARWCATVGLADRARESWKRVLDLDGDHAEARAALGYQRVGDAWMTEDEVMTSRGLVKFRGRWVSPEERDLVLAVEEQKDLDRKVSSALKAHLEKTGHPDPAKRAEAEEALAKIEDGPKPRVFLGAITDDSKLTRLYVVKELGRLKAELKAPGADVEAKAVRALARRAIWDEAESVRDAAALSLKSIAHPDTVSAYAPYLGEAWRIARLRTLGRLEAYADLRPVPAVIELAESADATVKFIKANQENLKRFLAGHAITRDGRRIPVPRSIRFVPSTADQDAVADAEEEKQACLDTLKALTGESLGADPAAWRAWWERRTPK